MANYRAGDLERWAEKIEKSLDQVVRATCLDLSRRIIDRTPVDTGRLKGNWVPTINSPAGYTIESSDKSGVATIAKAGRVANEAAGNVFFLVNNLPYATVAEYGLWSTGQGATYKTTRDGYSVQAPYGMVRVTVTEFTTALRKAVNSQR